MLTPLSYLYSEYVVTPRRPATSRTENPRSVTCRIASARNSSVYRLLDIDISWAPNYYPIRCLQNQGKSNCPKCLRPFSSIPHPAVPQEQIDIVCTDYGRRPVRYYINGRPFGVRKLYKDTRGILFDSFLAAHRQLEEMRLQFDAHTFDPAGTQR